MDRKRSLACNAFTGKRRRTGCGLGETEAGAEGGGSANPNQARHYKTCRCVSVATPQLRDSLRYLMSLFPRKLFNDELPPIAMKHQLYSLHGDRTGVDRQLSEMRARGELLMFHMGFDSESLAVVFTEDYRDKVLTREAGRETLGAVEKFLNNVLSSCFDMSFNKSKMLQEFMFSDPEITKLVRSGVLTVKDAGSWWLSVPNTGRFIKYFLQGRKAVLTIIKKSKYNEILQSELEERRTKVKLQIKYHIHDIIGAELVECKRTASGTVLRHAEV